MQLTTYAAHYSDDFSYNHRLLENSWDFPSHIHDVCELIYIRRGEATYTVEGRSYQLSKHCLAIVRPLQMHSIQVHAPSVYERYNILFDEKKLSTDIFTRISPGLDVIHCDGNTLIYDLFKKMDYYCENVEIKYLEYTLFHLVEELLLNVVLTGKNSQQDMVYTTNPLINEAIIFIEKNITTPLNIRDLCRELHTTNSHLHDLFSKHLKVSPKQYILSKQLAIAQRELRAGGSPTEIYVNCGFSDYSTFFKAYKRTFGHAPSDEAYAEVIREIES